MGKIGQSARLKADEAAPYVTLGIVKVGDGYELRKVTISGLEVLHMKVLKKETERAAIMMELNIALINYNINFNQNESGE
jgi:hypothetical protein